MTGSRGVGRCEILGRPRPFIVFFTIFCQKVDPLKIRFVIWETNFFKGVRSCGIHLLMPISMCSPWSISGTGNSVFISNNKYNMYKDFSFSNQSIMLNMSVGHTTIDANHFSQMIIFVILSS